MIVESLRLRVTACKSERQLAFDEFVDFDVYRRADSRVEWLERVFVVEESWRHRVRVVAEERLKSLMDLPGYMHPTKLVNRRVDTGVRRFAGYLGVVRRLLEA